MQKWQNVMIPQIAAFLMHSNEFFWILTEVCRILIRLKNEWYGRTAARTSLNPGRRWSSSVVAAGGPAVAAGHRHVRRGPRRGPRRRRRCRNIFLKHTFNGFLFRTLARRLEALFCGPFFSRIGFQIWLHFGFQKIQFVEFTDVARIRWHSGKILWICAEE